MNCAMVIELGILTEFDNHDTVHQGGTQVGNLFPLFPPTGSEKEKLLTYLVGHTQDIAQKSALQIIPRCRRLPSVLGSSVSFRQFFFPRSFLRVICKVCVRYLPNISLSLFDILLYPGPFTFKEHQRTGYKSEGMARKELAAKMVAQQTVRSSRGKEWARRQGESTRGPGRFREQRAG
jgi:hypothetical protein